MMTRVMSALGLFLLAGCVAQVPQELPATHPANATAEEAPRAERSTVLALNAADPVQTGGHAAPAGRAASHEGMGHHEGAHHETTEGNPGAAARTVPSTQTAPGQQLYTCPMHPKVTATNPNEKCPVCKMKINKPVKAKAPTANSAHGAGDHDGHGGQH